MHKVLLVGLLTLWVNQSPASTVLQVDMDYLLSEATLIFEGEVLSQRSQWNNQHTAIFTAIVFRVDDVVKGEYSDNTITLNFSGGVVGEQGMKVSSMVYPQVGEKGIYFVSDPEIDFVNPLVGWTQGHFLVERDHNGEERIMTGGRDVVLDIVPASVAEPHERHATIPQTDHAHGEHDTPFSEGIATGVRVGNAATDKQRAMTKSAFKKALNDQLKTLKK